MNRPARQLPQDDDTLERYLELEQQGWWQQQNDDDEWIEEQIDGHDPIRR